MRRTLRTDVAIWTLVGAARSYSRIVENETSETEAARAGLCAECRFKRLILSDRGSTFYLCERSSTDASFPKYPRLPVLECRGYELRLADTK